MDLSFKIARRFLFGKKTVNAINIITGISVLGITIGAGSLVLILSVFNGFETLISSYFNAFNPEIKMLPARGKTILMDEEKIKILESIPGVKHYSKVLEEVVMLRYDDMQVFGVIKGVDDQYDLVNNIDSTIRMGSYKLKVGGANYGILGAGIAGQLKLVPEHGFEPLEVYIPKKEVTGPLDPFFLQVNIIPGGIFAVQSEADNKYLVCNLDVVEYLLQSEGQYSAIEIKTEGKVDQVIKTLEEQFGSDYVFQNRFEQDEVFLKIMNIEKWLSFAIVCLIIFLVAFNLIGSLWMIVLDKKKDISILKAMGATDGMVRKIFLAEGIWISSLGIIFGFGIAFLLYYLQKNIGLITVPDGFVISAYPVELRWEDFIIVAITVLIIGLLISIAPAYKAGQIKAFIREE